MKWLTKITVGPHRRHGALPVKRAIEVVIRKRFSRAGQPCGLAAAHCSQRIGVRISDIKSPLFLSRQLLLLNESNSYNP